MIHISVYRDNGDRFSSERRGVNSIINHNFDCVGNEAAINDCQTNDDRCNSLRDFADATQLRCKGKNQ